MMPFTDTISENIVRRRMHGLYLSRQCDDIAELSRELLGLHCWFHRNVAFSALIRGADITGWKTALIKTWLYRGTLHGTAFDDLPTLLALHSNGGCWLARYFGEEQINKIASEVISVMEDGVYSRAEMRQIFAADYDEDTIGTIFSPWGGIFVELARRGQVAFRDMTSRDFDLISAEPTQTADDVLPELLRRFFTAYGPATLNDAAWFFGFWKDDKKKLAAVNLDEFSRIEYNGRVYYYVDDGEEIADIPELTLLSGFDPLIVSYASDNWLVLPPESKSGVSYAPNNRLILPQEHKSKVILKSGICLPTIAVNGRVVGLWNIKKNAPVVEFFEEQPKRLERAAFDFVDDMRRRTTGRI